SNVLRRSPHGRSHWVLLRPEPTDESPDDVDLASKWRSDLLLISPMAVIVVASGMEGVEIRIPAPELLAGPYGFGTAPPQDSRSQRITRRLDNGDRFRRGQPDEAGNECPTAGSGGAATLRLRRYKIPTDGRIESHVNGVLNLAVDLPTLRA